MSVKMIKDILAGNTAVTALVSDRVFPLVRPQNLTLPAITLQRVISTPANIINRAVAPIDHDRLQLDAWDATYAGARALADACRSAINQAGYTLETELDDFNEGAALSGVYRIIQEYSVWH